MSNIYTIYNKELAPEALVAKQPQAPTYHDTNLASSIDVLLFVYTLEDVTGVAADSIVSLADMGFNHPYSEDGEGLTAVQLDATVDQYLTGVQFGSEVQVSKPQGQYLYDTRFKPEATE